MIRLLLLIVFVNGFLCAVAESRPKPPDLEKRITISFDKISLKNALDRLAAKGVTIEGPAG